MPLAQNQALGIAIMSYDGRLAFGLLGDYDAMRDLDALADDLDARRSTTSRAPRGVARRAGRRRAAPPAGADPETS